jgi:hypothetical protein
MLGLVLLGAIVVSVWSLFLNQAQESAVKNYCDDLKSQNYESAFKLLSGNLQADFSGAGLQNHDQFVQVMKTFDTVNGKVTDCGLDETTHNPFVFPWVATGKRSFRIQRLVETRGRVTLIKDANNNWKLDDLDTSLLKVSLGAVARAISYCKALQDLNFGAAYQALNKSPDQETLREFSQAQIDHQEIDGAVTDCKVTSIPENLTQSSTEAHLGIQIVRSNLDAPETGTLDLMNAPNTGWVIEPILAGLNGTDIGPLQKGDELCTDLEQGSSGLHTAYELLSSAYQAQLSEEQFDALFPQASAEAYHGCLHDFSTYRVSTTNASLSLGMKISSTDATKSQTLHMMLEMTNENGAWKVSGITTTYS